MKQYSSPVAELLKLATEDIMSLSPGLSSGETGGSGGEMDFGDFTGGNS